MNYLIDLVTGGVCLFKVTANMHIVVTYLNEGGCRLFGTTKENLQRNAAYRLDELIYPEDKSRVFTAIGRAMATGENVDIEMRTIMHKDEFHWCKLNAAIQKYDENNMPVFHAMITDITRIKEAEGKADRMNDALVKMFKNLPDPIFCTDTDDMFKLRIVSEDFIKFLGFSRHQLFEEHDGRLDDFVSDRKKKYVEATIRKKMQQGEKISVRYSIRTKNGNFIVVEDRRKVVDQDGGMKSMICRLRDVTKGFVGNVEIE
ncbi:MAG: PAS domain-containing protein [Clostridiales bacterium]|nr:PAS domain-containing protein [Clostridiales bacterium]